MISCNNYVTIGLEAVSGQLFDFSNLTFSNSSPSCLKRNRYYLYKIGVSRSEGFFFLFWIGFLAMVAHVFVFQVLEHCRALGVHARVLPENRAIIPYLEKKMLDLGITGPEGFYQSRPEEVGKIFFSMKT